MYSEKIKTRIRGETQTQFKKKQMDSTVFQINNNHLVGKGAGKNLFQVTSE